MTPRAAGRRGRHAGGGSTRRPWLETSALGFQAAASALAIALCAAPTCAAGALPASLPDASIGALRPIDSKLDPRLRAAAVSAGAETVAVWLELRDKGERSPAELAELLARAEASLAPRARARRLRAHVTPLVDYRDLPVYTPYLDALGSLDMPPFALLRWENRVAVRLPAHRLVESARLPFVERVSPVEKAMRSRDPGPDRVTPSRPEGRRDGGSPRSLADYGFSREQLAQIGVPALHDSGYIGTGILICILDDGFNGHDRHEALRPVAIAPGRKRDFVEGDTTVTDSTAIFGFYHGTWVMGCLAGLKPGIYLGAAYGAEFALARTENDLSETPEEMTNWAMAAEWADSLGADIISSSVGYFQFDGGTGSYTYADMDGRTTVVSRAAQIAASKGILVVNAVGNEGASSWHYLIAPADVNGDSLIAVGAVNDAGAPASFSSFGPNARGFIKPDLVARGVSDFVPHPYDTLTYEMLSGTSFAAPLVAGLAACLMQARPAWSPVDLVQALRSTASRAFDPDNQVGYGLPNGAAALHPPSLPDGAGATRGPLTITLGGSNPLRSDRLPLRFALRLASETTGALDLRLLVLDASGRRVRSLWSGMLSPGQRTVAEWNGRDDDGRSARPGLYWVALIGGKHRVAVRVALIE